MKNAAEKYWLEKYTKQKKKQEHEFICSKQGCEKPEHFKTCGQKNPPTNVTQTLW